MDKGVAAGRKTHNLTGTIERESRCHVQSDNFSDTPCVNDQTHGLWAGNPCATGENNEQFSQAVPNGEFE